MIREPLFKHDCEHCTFLGSDPDPDSESFKLVDWYGCEQGRLQRYTIITRYSDEPSDYHSFWPISSLAHNLSNLNEFERDALSRAFRYLQTLNKEGKLKSNDDYWRTALANRHFEAEKLTMIAKLVKFHSECGEKMSLLNFYHSKRPYGNKDIDQSIAFNLGWDNAERRLTWHSDLPDWVKVETQKIHKAVLETLTPTL